MTKIIQSRWQVYFYDLKNKGFLKFILDRIKKRRYLRCLLYFFRKPFVMVSGKKLYINKMDTVVSETLMSTGVWEPAETKIFIKFLNNAKLVVDIGANIGYYTLIASKSLEKTGRVIAFEPEKNNFNLLFKTIVNNKIKNTILEKKAVDIKSGNKYIYINNDNYGDHRIYNFGDKRKRQAITVTSLDDYFYPVTKKIDLLKIDIQGFELKALKGAKVLLKDRKIKVILSELWPVGLRMAGDSWISYIKYLKSYGFVLYQIDGEFVNPILLSPDLISKKIKDEPDYTTNILALLKTGKNL